ncbi:leucyl/phenylalanyl-tRNA--protein transferase [Cognatiluteimonas profundi]|uniref:leucyl/phenylalanyl-tRNA--protein transferase n=1 Tax=Cognatiluteimonas profundi TaxID=2594501 RepID=UPI00131AC770|nr:leucyl/phenylalanyl-tRNA--protein transferase [Lysobacter profundi]
MQLTLPWLDADPAAPFPPADSALVEPAGLLAAGGDLSPARLLNAYRSGVFPWFSEGQPLLWWCPDPRAVFRTDGVLLSRRFRRQLRSSHWVLRADTAFDEVVAACARTPRPGQKGTWITAGMQAAYGQLHRMGHAHSIEVFDGGRLVGGIYGVAIGRMFFGESMYSGVSGASKAALAGLAFRLREWGWPLIDAQVENPHLDSLGAESWPRERFLREIAALTARNAPTGAWTGRFGELAAASLSE